ncbi:MAG TPA: hypothetical protein VII94_00950 [Candidatus Saccharimonadales bacterium]
MTAFLLPPPIHKFLVVGPLHDKIEKLSIIEDMMPNYDWIIFNGGLCEPTSDLENIKNRIEKMDKLISSKKVVYLSGRSDFLLFRELQGEYPAIGKWIMSRPNVAIAKFPTRYVLIMDGGIPPNIIGSRQLLNNLEVSFIYYIDNKPWHLSYNGTLGYVISNNPLTNKAPQYYNYSMQLGNLSGNESQIYAQEVDEIGLKRNILI